MEPSGKTHPKGYGPLLLCTRLTQVAMRGVGIMSLYPRSHLILGRAPIRRRAALCREPRCLVAGGCRTTHRDPAVDLARLRAILTLVFVGSLLEGVATLGISIVFPTSPLLTRTRAPPRPNVPHSVKKRTKRGFPATAAALLPVAPPLSHDRLAMTTF